MLASLLLASALRFRPGLPGARWMKFLDCGGLDSGFARVRCESCHAEFLVAFSGKVRIFCPSCHAKRLEIWSDWLEHELLYAVPHRQYVFTVPKRLRPFFLHDRKLLGVLCRVAYRTLRDFLRTTFREPGVVASIQTFGSLVNWHPQLHLVVTDGAFRPDGTFLHLGYHEKRSRSGARNPDPLDDAGTSSKGATDAASCYSFHRN